MVQWPPVPHVLLEHGIVRLTRRNPLTAMDAWEEELHRTTPQHLSTTAVSIQGYVLNPYLGEMRGGGGVLGYIGKLFRIRIVC